MVIVVKLSYIYSKTRLLNLYTLKCLIASQMCITLIKHRSIIYCIHWSLYECVCVYNPNKRILSYSKSCIMWVNETVLLPPRVFDSKLLAYFENDIYIGDNSSYVNKMFIYYSRWKLDCSEGTYRADTILNRCSSITIDITTLHIIELEETDISISSLVQHCRRL